MQNDDIRNNLHTQYCNFTKAVFFFNKPKVTAILITIFAAKVSQVGDIDLFRIVFWSKAATRSAIKPRAHQKYFFEKKKM